MEAAEAALEALGTRFTVFSDEPADDRMTFLDTFDWRIYRAGLVLTARSTGGKTVLWLATRDGPDLGQLVLSLMPGFTRDLPSGVVRKTLEPVVEMRRLKPVVTLVDHDQRLRVVDDLEKTVVRVVLRTGEASAGESTGAIRPLLLLFPIRGYGSALTRVRAFLEDDVGLAGTKEASLTAALEAVGRSPGDYTGKLVLSLDPGTRADEAARTIHRALLETIRRNEQGTLADTDSEFLHDFRVAVRRTRSALSQIRDVFPPEDVERFKEGFRWLGQVTGPTRDLDVYLLKLPGYAQSLPRKARGDLDALGDFLCLTQKREQEKLARALSSERYLELIAEWRDFLASPPPMRPAAPNAKRPIADVAGSSIRRSWRRLRKKGREIDADSPPELLHRLRIEAKKLRYLLTFFRSLYPERTIDGLVSSLKKLQDNLGDFNDFGVQQAALKDFGERMLKEGAPVEAIMAMGRLVERLEAGEAKERRRFAKRFLGFTSRENRRLFRDLFGSRRKGDRPA